VKRRTVLQSLLALPGAAALEAQDQAPRPAINETPNTPTFNADSLADTTIHTFRPEQLAALKRLGEILEPSTKDAPGANEARTAEFLDFLIGQSPAPIAELYQGGLDALNAGARQRYNKPFASLTDLEAAPILSPLRKPWTHRPPEELLSRFLLQAKDDIRRATVTSREYIAVVSQRRRGAGGSGQYWLPVD
jgi:hypothetical protein